MEDTEITPYDYIEWDKYSQAHSDTIKPAVIQLDKLMRSNLLSNRSRAIALTKLEECWMFVGKSIREEQLEREQVQHSVPPDHNS